MKADIAIVGAGPAGLAAAATALSCMRHVVLIDDNPNVGGQIWRNKQPLAAHAAMLEHPRLCYLPSTRVVAAPGAGQLLLETASDAINLHYERLIVATGARERLLPFPGWTLPGVMGAGGLQAMVKNGMNVRGQRVILAGTGPLLLAAAESLTQAGAEVLLIAEQARAISLARFALSLLEFPTKLAQAAALRWSLRSVPYHTNSYVRAAIGKQRLHAVIVHSGSRTFELACDWLGTGYGLLPNSELLQTLGCMMNAESVWVDDQLRTSIPNIFAAGESTGAGGVDKALLEGRLAGLAASGCLSGTQGLARQRQRHLRFANALARHFAPRPEISALVNDDTIVCRCEDVTHGRIATFDNWREAKLQTRCGMGPCQGRLCASACNTLYGWRDANARPPLQPARLATLAGVTVSTTPDI